jgi:hypothetical protein
MFPAICERLVCALVVAVCFAVPARAQEPANPTAPVPTQIAAAKKIFISYAGTQIPYASGEAFQDYSGDPDRAYYQFYAALKSLGRYELLSTPANADLILEIEMPSQLFAAAKGTENVYVLRVRILDPASHVTLWGFERSISNAITQKNRDKNFDQTLNGIVQDFVALTNKH